jgi:hypothetical protein
MLRTQVLEWTLLNSFVAYTGYLLAAVHIDQPWMGRMRLQSFGFLMSFILFICCAAAYHQLVHPGERVPSLLQRFCDSVSFILSISCAVAYHS